MGIERRDLKGLPLAELEEFLSGSGKQRYRARQIFRWIYQRFVCDFGGMTDLSLSLRAELDKSCRIFWPQEERILVSGDGTEKYFFFLEDGEVVEAVLIPDEGRRTLCVSSQAGCALRCSFCATGALGFRRNLSSSEIIHQVCFAAKRLLGRGERLSNVVFMGMGEPLENLREVARAIDILLSQYGFGLSGKRVTVSTAGIVPALLELAGEYPVSFAVSINAARDDLRSRLMPVNRRYPLGAVLEAVRKIPLRSGRRVTAEYVLIGGVNDSEQDARELAALFAPARVKVNLIPYNPHELSDFRPPRPESVDRFREVLVARGIQVMTRQRRGADIEAACGQLRGRERAKKA